VRKQRRQDFHDFSRLVASRALAEEVESGGAVLWKKLELRWIRYGVCCYSMEVVLE
jgi:hypothetical protein